MKRLNRVLAASGIALATSLWAASSAMAQTTSGDVTIGGTVVSTLNIAITPVGGVDTGLDLGGEGVDNGETIVKVADITITTNNNTGLSLTLTSGNLTAGGDTNLPYQVASTADTVAAVTADFSVASGTAKVENFTQVGGAAPNLGADGSLARDVSISYDPPQNLDAGAYTATITLSVADL